MSTNNHHLTGGPAYPSKFYNDSNQFVTAPDGSMVPPGQVIPMMGATLRDLFAGQALAGIEASQSNSENFISMVKVADRAYLLADAMVARRAKIGIPPQADVDGDAQKVAPGQADTESMAIQALHKVAHMLGMNAGADVVRDIPGVLQKLLDEQKEEREVAEIIRRDRNNLAARLSELQREAEQAAQDRQSLPASAHIIMGDGRTIGLRLDPAKDQPGRMPAHLRAYLERVVDAYLSQIGSGLMECAECHAIGKSKKSVIHSTNCTIGEAQLLIDRDDKARGK